MYEAGAKVAHFAYSLTETEHEIAKYSVILGAFECDTKPDDALRLLSKGMELSQNGTNYKILPKKYVVIACQTLARIHRQHKHDLETALDFFEQAEEISDLDDEITLFRYYQEYAKILLEQNKLNHALNYNQKCLSIALKLKGPEDYLTLECYITMADNYTRLEKKELANQMFENCMGFFDKYEE
jgi:tetratricopeptide (TPR) repeat protein